MTPSTQIACGALALLVVAIPPARCGAVHHDCGPIRLDFDGGSGAWVGLRHQGSDINLLSPQSGTPEVEIAAEEGPSFPSQGRRLVAHRAARSGDGWRCEIETADGPWRVTCSYQVEPEVPVIRRSVSLRWLGQESVKITGVTLRVPGVAIGGAPDNFYLLPSSFPLRRRTFSGLDPGRRENESGVWANTALALVYSPRHRLSLAAGYELVVDGAHVVVEEERGAASIAHQFHTLARLQPGDSLDCDQCAGCGRQWVLVARGSWEDALRGLRRLSDSLGNGPPADRPPWIDRCAIYSCYPGGSNDTGFRGGGSLADFEQRLPYLARLGFTALWLNPINTPPPWLYSIRDYRAIAENLGAADDLKRFVARAHALGMKVLLDLVPHGPDEDTPAARDAPPDAWTYDEAGNLVRAWGGLAGDYASRAWQGYMAQVAAYWVREFGVDGYRVDCAYGNEPNWKRGDGRRPSASSPLGGLELLRSVREAIRPLNPDAALFPEAWAPILFRYGDLVYDYPFYQVMRKLTLYPATEAWIRDARAWLQMERLTYPSGALDGLVRFVENHDTVRSDELFGIGPAQALTALCVFAQGTPMIYQDQEIGFGEELKQWLNLRGQCPELRTGAADYEAVRCSDPGVLAFLRSDRCAGCAPSGAAVVAINFLGREVTARLEWPRETGKHYPFASCAGAGRFSARGNGAASVTIPPYRAAVILLRAGGTEAVPPDRAPRGQAAAGRAQHAAPLRLAEDASAAVGGTEYRLRLAPVKWWFVNTGEGLLLDRFIDRHTLEPIPRCERLWRPLEAGLWDGPGYGGAGGTGVRPYSPTCRGEAGSPAGSGGRERPLLHAIGLIAGDGRAVIVSGFDLDSLTSVRLDDASHRGEAVEVSVHARGNERPFIVSEVADGWAAVHSIEPPPSPPARLVTADPLRVTLHNKHYRVVLSRRRGGLISHLAVATNGGFIEAPLLGSDLYTDWGLYDRGVHVSAEAEATPRLEIARSGEATEVTFRGVLRTPSWNGVQRGYPAPPLIRYRVTYRVDESPVLRVTFGLTPESDRADVEAFFAYVLSLGEVADWYAETEQGRLAGKPGADPGARLFETSRVSLAASRPYLGLGIAGREITFRPRDSDGLPQNVFFLDQGPGKLALFVAMLDGEAVALPAAVERAASFEITF